MYANPVMTWYMRLGVILGQVRAEIPTLEALGIEMLRLQELGILAIQRRQRATEFPFELIEAHGANILEIEENDRILALMCHGSGPPVDRQSVEQSYSRFPVGLSC